MFLLAFCSYLGYYSVKFGINVPPSSTGDEPSYDSLGWELAKGNGFSVDYDDPDLRRPYDLAAQGDPELYTLIRGKSGPIAYRPPLFPLVIAATNLCVGRQFWLIRVFNAFCMSATCGLVSHYLLKRFGIFAAVLGAGTFVVCDYRTRLYGRAILTEAMACLLIALLVLTIQRSSNSRQLRWAAVAGTLAGLLILTRTVFALWIPWVVLTMIVTSRRNRGHGLRSLLAKPAIFCVVALLVASPWMIRNTYVLGSLKPLGTQGLMELSAGYSEAAFSNGGVWINLSDLGFYRGVIDEDMTTLERELASARHSSSAAREWILAHPGKALLLFPMKIVNEFRPREPSEWIVSGLAIVGLLQLAAFRDGRVLIGMLIANACTIGCTWSVGGRFLVPQLFVFHVLAGAGAWSLALRLARPTQRSHER
jgi:4-amino-4-deoxy-L-arabinose transferase-like glycosyltransferase